MLALVARGLKIAMTSLIAAWVTLATAGTSPAAAAQDPIFKDKTIEIYGLILENGVLGGL